VAECSFCGEAFDHADDSGLTFVVVPTREIGGVRGVTKVQQSRNPGRFTATLSAWLDT
jgi:hypothetical protein